MAKEKLMRRKKVEDQAYRYNKETWTESEAESHCKDHGGTFEPALKEEKQTYTCECLDCGYTMKTDEHCRNIKCPKCGGEMRRIERPGPGKEIEGVEEKGVIPYKDYGTAPENAPWDAGKEVRKADVNDLKIMCAWYDSANPDLKGSYKLPHHRQSTKVAVWHGVAAAMGALLGARGGVKIPAKDKKGVYNHLAKHYKQFDKRVPELKDYTKEEYAKLFPKTK